jgi:hypothetical protein
MTIRRNVYLRVDEAAHHAAQVLAVTRRQSLNEVYTQAIIKYVAAAGREVQSAPLGHLTSSSGSRK